MLYILTLYKPVGCCNGGFRGGSVLVGMGSWGIFVGELCINCIVCG